jgi:hypothetical protein
MRFIVTGGADGAISVMHIFSGALKSKIQMPDVRALIESNTGVSKLSALLGSIKKGITVKIDREP